MTKFRPKRLKIKKITHNNLIINKIKFKKVSKNGCYIYTDYSFYKQEKLKTQKNFLFSKQNDIFASRKGIMVGWPSG